MVQVVLNAQGQPRYAAYAQHGTASKRLWQYVDKIGEHPVVYVALGSHASYFKPYKYRHRYEDIPLTELLGVDDAELVIVPTQPIPIELLPRTTAEHWLNFKGRWGGEKASGEIAIEQDGVTGPAQKGEQWHNPLQWSDNDIPWDEEAEHNRYFKLQAITSYPYDLHVYERLTGRHVGRKDGAIEIGIPSAEYFDNSVSSKRSILVHKPLLPVRLNYVVEIRRLVITATPADSRADAEPVIISLSYPDFASSETISATFTLSASLSVSGTATISITQSGEPMMSVDADGNGVVDAEVPPVQMQRVTGDGVPPAAISDLTATAIADNVINLTWTATGDDGSSGKASAYDIRYRTAPITDSNWVSATSVISPPLPSQAGAQESLAVTNLPGGTYYFAIRAFDDAFQFSELSNQAQANVPYRIYAPIAQR